MADFADRSLGIGYPGGVAILFVLLLLSLGLWWRTEGTVSVNRIATPRAEAFYWITILFSNTLGTALGDFLADDGVGTGGLGIRRRLAGVRRRHPADRGGLLRHQHLPHPAVLGRLHSHPPTRRHVG